MNFSKKILTIKIILSILSFIQHCNHWNIFYLHNNPKLNSGFKQHAIQDTTSAQTALGTCHGADQSDSYACPLPHLFQTLITPLKSMCQIQYKQLDNWFHRDKIPSPLKKRPIVTSYMEIYYKWVFYILFAVVTKISIHQSNIFSHYVVCI